MELANNEIKLQAKKLLKRIKSGETLTTTLTKQLSNLPIELADIQLKHCLTLVARRLGFFHWHEAQQFFTGASNDNSLNNWGTYLYPERGDVFINEWFSTYTNAKQIISEQPGQKWLLPYKTQFIVVEKDYIDNFRLDTQTAELWRSMNYDMKASYNSNAWDHLTAAILKQQFLNSV